MVLVQKELQNAYIGEYKEPIYEYSYTFKGKTATEIGNEWTTQVGTIAVNSDGATGTSSQEMRITKSIPSLATAKRIVINGTIVGQNLSTTAGDFGIGKGTGWGTGSAGYQAYGSSYSGMKVYIYYNNTNTNGNSVGNATGQTYKPTLTIDLENKTMVGSITGFNNSTLSLTDAQVADIRNYEHLVCYTSLNRSTMSDISIKIY